jgi:hypothetical protein
MKINQDILRGDFRDLRQGAKIVWHILKKDFRRLWPLLALWWGVLALRGFEPTWDLATPYKDWDWWTFHFAEIRPIAMMVVDTLLLIVIGAAAIRDDSPIRSFAHWRTLPLAGGRVLRAKILFLVVFCGVAGALISIATKITYGFPAAELLAGLAWYEWKIAVCVALGAMLASLFHHPFFTPVVVVISYCCCAVLCNLPAIWYIQVEGMGNGDDGSTLYLSRFLVWSNLLLVATLGVVVYMYYSRRRWPTILILAAGVVLAQAAQGLWPIDFFGPPKYDFIYMPVPPAAIAALKLQFSPLALDWNENERPGYQYRAEFEAKISGLRSSHPGEAWFADQGSWVLPLPDGKKIDLMGGMGSPLPTNYAEVLQTLGLDKLPEVKNELYGGSGKHYAYSASLNLLELNLLEQAGSQKTRPKLPGGLMFHAGQMTRIADAPVTPGAHLARAEDDFTIQSVHVRQGDNPEFSRIYRTMPAGLTPEYVEIELLIQSVASAGAPLGTVHEYGSSWYREYSVKAPAYFFVLWNPQQHEVVPAFRLPIAMPTESEDRYGQNEGNGLSIRTYTNSILFEFYHAADSTPWSPQEIQAWLTGARLVELRYQWEHDYYVPADIDHLDIPDHITTHIPKDPTPVPKDPTP